MGKAPTGGREPGRTETGAVRKKRQGRIAVALVYPNTYHVGMSNLGFQAAYRLFNAFDHVACERAFLPDDGAASRRGAVSVESGAPLSEFDIIAFSISFENDFYNLLTILHDARLSPRAADRNASDPLIMAGGAVFFLNPEPIAPFIDCFLIGEAEALLDDFFTCYDVLADKAENLKRLARTVAGVYVPAFYTPAYNQDGTFQAYAVEAGAPDRVRRVYVKDLTESAASTAVLTPDTLFDDTFLMETERGCPRGCRFCGAGFVYRPPRFRSMASMKKTLMEGAVLTRRIGFVGAAVSDLPEIDAFCDMIQEADITASFSSLRADGLTPGLLNILKKNKVKTATIAPDAGSERMRRVINKGLTEARILDAAELLVTNSVPNLKLYFMVGLPTETMADVDAIVALVKKIKHRFLKASRARRRIGTVTVSLNCFIPKPFTPFQWAAMDEVKTLKQKIKAVKDGLKRTPNVRVHSDLPRWAYVQALLSRGDRRVADILELARKLDGNWPQTLKETPLNADFYVLRERGEDEVFPWEIIDHGLKRSFLRREYEMALAEKASPPCPMVSCDVCGVCRRIS